MFKNRNLENLTIKYQWVKLCLLGKMIYKYIYYKFNFDCNTPFDWLKKLDYL